MPFFNWSEDYSVGVKQFDIEHQRLIIYLNKLHVGMVAGDPVAAMSKILDGLIDYTGTHFRHEEELMIEYNYPDYEKHKAEHEALVAKVLDFKTKLEEGKSSFTLELMGFLKDWLMNHIKGSDTNYKDFFNQKGVS